MRNIENKFLRYMNKQKITETVKGLIWNLTRKFGLGWLIISLYPKSILVQDGWFKSYRKNIPIDSSGNLIPWLTYSFIHFITPRLNKDFSLFEYGCGYSTVWYCNKVKNVISVENNSKWALKISQLLPVNGKILFHSGFNTPPLCGVIRLPHESSAQKKS